MSETESSEGHKRKIEKPVHIPEGFVDAALAGNRPPLPFFEHSVTIPGVGEGMLHVEHRLEGGSPDTAPTLKEKIYSTLYFGYAARSPQGNLYAGVAEMTLRVHGPRLSELRHRKVIPEFRHQHGIGTALLNQVEDPVRRHVEKTRVPMEIYADLSQYDVLKWLTKAEYKPRTKKDEKLLADITEGLKTGRYMVEENTYGADDRYMLIFKVVDGVRNAQPERLSLRKIIVPEGADAT